MDIASIIEPSRVPSPMHLVISPYPMELECHCQTKDGANVFVRPIRPEDAPVKIERN